MPLEVKDVEWSETEQNITLKVPLKGANSKNVDIFSSSTYVKVSFPPYYFEVGLFDEIDDDASKATIFNGQILFHLLKCSPRIWGQLYVSQHKDKAFMRELRETAIKNKQAKEQERDKIKAQMKDQQKKFAVREQMRVDSEERKMREEQKQVELKEISQDMEEWKLNNKNIDIDKVKERNHQDLPVSESRDANMDWTEKEANKPTANTTSDRNEKNKVSSATLSKKPTKYNGDEDKKKPLPQPRATGNIQVDFTPRQLATPARESKLPEEDMWLKKVAEMNKMKPVQNKDDITDMEEMNPVWLKDKGNAFFKKGNYVAAINAYTSALILDASIPMIYANRAACHLSLQQYKECIQDCTNALELYDPPVADNAMSRCRALTRRGTAYFQLEEYVKALQDYEAAIKLNPTNDALRSDAFKIRRTLQSGDSSD